MSDLVCKAPSFPSMRNEDVEKARRLERSLLDFEQVRIATTHHFHGGMYARTIRVPKGVAMTGALIKVPTLLVFSGSATVFIGSETVFINGYHVIAASAGRKQAFIAHEDTDLTMIFPSEADSVEAAEIEFTDEHELLMSRKEEISDLVIRTGE